MNGAAPHPDLRVEATWNALARVFDPELDEAVVALGFMLDVALAGEHGIHVRRRSSMRPAQR